jgi:hypothetical protein
MSICLAPTNTQTRFTRLGPRPGAGAPATPPVSLWTTSARPVLHGAHRVIVLDSNRKALSAFGVACPPAGTYCA